MKMNGYLAFYNGKKIEIIAEDLYSAKQQAIKKLNVNRKKEYMVTVILAEKNGKTVTHIPLF
jgi:hypothetical protein